MDREFPFWQMRIVGEESEMHPEMDAGGRLPYLIFDAVVETLTFPFQRRQSPTKTEALYRLLDRIIPKSVWKSE